MTDGKGFVTIGLGLGGNLGDPPTTIGKALHLLEDRGHVRIDAISRLYRTKPWGPVAQPDFANACAIGATRLEPHALLTEVKAIETMLGRASSQRWGPRAIDIDILFYAGEALDTPDLVIPHESLFERAFVLIPLAEVAPDLELAGQRIGDAAKAVDASGVRHW